MAPGDPKSERSEPTDWGALTDRALAGDRVAYARLARLVTGYLARWRAYDFRADWEDMVQEVLISTVSAYREGRFETAAAFQAYVRQATRFKFIDRIRAQERSAPGADRETAMEAGEGPDAPWPPEKSVQSQAYELRLSVQAAIESLGERQRQAVLEVHIRGRTYEEAAAATGIPLGSLKRELRSGLARLREVLADARAD